MFVVAVGAVGGMLLSNNSRVNADASQYLWSGQGAITGQYFDVGVVAPDDDINLQARGGTDNVYVRLTGDQFIKLDFSHVKSLNPFDDYQFSIPVTYYIQKWPLVKTLSCALKDNAQPVITDVSLTINANPLAIEEEQACSEKDSGLTVDFGTTGKTMLRLGMNELKVNMGREISRTLYVYVKDSTLPNIGDGTSHDKPASITISRRDLGGTANLYLESITPVVNNETNIYKSHLDLVKTKDNNSLQVDIWSSGRNLSLSNEVPVCQVMRATTTMPIENISFESSDRTDTASRTIVTINEIKSLVPNNYDITIACRAGGDEYQEHFVLAVE